MSKLVQITMPIETFRVVHQCILTQAVTAGTVATSTLASFATDDLEIFLTEVARLREYAMAVGGPAAMDDSPAHVFAVTVDPVSESARKFIEDTISQVTKCRGEPSRARN